MAPQELSQDTARKNQENMCQGKVAATPWVRRKGCVASAAIAEFEFKNCGKTCYYGYLPLLLLLANFLCPWRGEEREIREVEMVREKR